MGKEKNLNQLREDLQKDVQDYATNIAKFMAQKIADDMTEVTQTAIESFYSQYDPEDYTKHNGHIYYYRHWNFKKSYKRYYYNRNPRFIGGVELLRSDIPDVYYGKNSDPQSVFDRVYLGYHGIASFQNCNPPVPILSPSPYRIIRDKFKDIQKHLKDYENEAAQKARKQQYRRLFK